MNVCAQVAANTFVSAAAYLLLGVSFLIPFRVAGFFHLSHGAVYTAGAYLALVLSVGLGLPLGIGVLGGVGLCAVLGFAIEVGVYRPLRRRSSRSPLILLLASLGMYIALQNAVSLVFGDEARMFPGNAVREGLELFGARVTGVQLMTLLVGVLTAGAAALFLRGASLGKAMRAVAVDPELAIASGIDAERVTLWAFVSGSALVGGAGIMASLDIGMTPTMGLSALLAAIVVVIIGGLRSVPGIAVGSLSLALAQQLGAWFFGSRWQDAIAFLVLIAFLLLRPYGVFGRKLRKAQV